MLDPKLIRNDIETVKASLRDRAKGVDLEELHRLATGLHETSLRVQELASKKNQLNADIQLLRFPSPGINLYAAARSRYYAHNFNLDTVTQLAASNSKELKSKRQDLTGLEEAFAKAAAQIPNLPAEDVPAGASEDCNKPLKTFDRGVKVGKTSPSHWDVLVESGCTENDAAAAMAGARFSVLTGQAARLHRAIGQMMLDAQIERGYREVMTPFVVHPVAPFGAGQFPKFEDDAFHTQDGRVLISTGEVPLVNLLRNTTLKAEDLPWKVAALTPCFRKEAGSYGRDTHGLIRQHQFEKVELVAATTNDDSESMFSTLLDDAGHVLDLLELPWRQVKLCAGDMGFAARRTIDLEVWMPGQSAFREISSVSWCGDFQARRLKARCKTDSGSEFVHTFNASGVAVGRALAAVIENHIDHDRQLHVPKALRPYMKGAESIDFAAGVQR